MRVVRVFPGYLVIDWGNINSILDSYKHVTSIRENELLFIDFKGNIILENVNSLHFDEENMVKYSIKDNGEELYGAIKLDDSNWKIAPKFCYLSLSSLDSNIKGKLTSNGEIIIVNPNISYSHEYKDTGEKLFEQKKWDEVLDFYKNEGVDAPWAKFFSGGALYYKAIDILTKIEFYIASIKGYAKSTNGLIKFPEPVMDVPALLPDIEHMGFTSSQLLSQYLAEDTIYANKARTLMSIKEYTQDKSQKLYADYEIAMKMANEKDQKAMAQLEARRQRIQDERSQLLESICGIFLKNLYNSISNNSPSGSRDVGTGYSVGTSSSNKSMSTDSRYKADWENRRSNAQRQLERYMEQLKRDPNNSALKHNIHSTQEVIKTCDEALSR